MESDELSPFQTVALGYVCLTLTQTEISNFQSSSLGMTPSARTHFLGVRPHIRTYISPLPF